MSKHECETVIISGSRMELMQPIDSFVEANLGHKTFDWVALHQWHKQPFLDEVLRQVEISCRLHKTQQGILIDYLDKNSPEEHADNIRNAATVIREAFPSLGLTGFIVDNAGIFNKIL